MKDDFDFDEWKELAEKDPAAFEQKRAEAIDKLLAKTPKEYRQKLTHLRWKIDAVRKKHSSPQGAMIESYQMLMDMLCGEGGFVDVINGKPSKKNSEENITTDNVVSINRKKD